MFQPPESICWLRGPDKEGGLLTVEGPFNCLGGELLIPSLLPLRQEPDPGEGLQGQAPAKADEEKKVSRQEGPPLGPLRLPVRKIQLLCLR